MRPTAIVVSFLFLSGLAGAAPAAELPPWSPPSPCAEGPGRLPAWGLLARGGRYCVADFVTSRLFPRHPPIGRSVVGGELRYYGSPDDRARLSFGIAVDHGSGQGSGTWQKDRSPAAVARGEVVFTSVTVNGYWELPLSTSVRPYVGLGLGVGRYRGSYGDGNATVAVSSWLPVATLPVGLRARVTERLSLSLEGRFINGFSAGGAAEVRF